MENKKENVVAYNYKAVLTLVTRRENRCIWLRESTDVKGSSISNTYSEFRDLEREREKEMWGRITSRWFVVGKIATRANRL